jgi:hypothetical protein
MPELGSSARSLGVRPGIDVPATLPSDIVRPGQGGLSVSPDDPVNLPPYRRPPAFGGTGKDAVWVIQDMHLGGALVYRPDPMNPRHGFIEPASPMLLKDYQLAIQQTQSMWRKASPPPASGSTSDDN